jgi:hypothetical protein
MGSISAKWAISAFVSSHSLRTRPQRSAPVPSSSSPYTRNHKGSGQNSRTLYHSTPPERRQARPFQWQAPRRRTVFTAPPHPTLPAPHPAATLPAPRASGRIRTHIPPNNATPAGCPEPHHHIGAHHIERKSRLPRQLAPDPVSHPYTTCHRNASRRATTSHNDHPRRPPHHFHLAATFGLARFSSPT